jgi:glycosyltransferase involved in cell wall biosynthesis
MITVITPVYNGERFIAACIQNVIDQGCPDVEHVIIDGGSSDKTTTIIADYAQIYPHIRWISEKDKGQSDAMNKGISMARHEFISFLNVDDFYEKLALSRFKVLAEQSPQTMIFVGNCRILGEDDEIISLNEPKKLDLFSLASLRSPFPLNPSAYFYNKSLHGKVGLYPIDEHYLMDIDFILKVASVSQAQYHNETWGNHRQIEGTKTVNSLNSGNHFSKIKKLILSRYGSLSLSQKLLILLELEFMYKARFIIKNPTAIRRIISKKLSVVQSKASVS